MIDKNWCVYKHTNLVNGKVYIGITGRKPEERWKNGYRQNKYFTSAINKYGWGGFSHEILFNGLTKDEAASKEIELIALYDSTNREKGYNISTGGDCSGAGVVQSEETRRKRGMALKGHETSKETRAKIRAAHLGVKKSESHGKHISDAKKGKCQGADHHRSKLIRCVETGVVYFGTGEASRLTGIERKNISAVCTGRRKIAGGYHWEYVKEEIA